MPGYPKPLTNLGLPSTVTKVDAAVYAKSTRKTYIFVNDQYWRWVFMIKSSLFVIQSNVLVTLK